MPFWSWIPLQYSLTLGPLIWLYVQLLTSQRPIFHRKYWWHLSPFLLEQGVFAGELFQSYHHNTPTYYTQIFWRFNPLLQVLALISVLSYLTLSRRTLNRYSRRLVQQFSDADRYEFRWLKRLLFVFGLIWLLWIPYFFVDYFFFDYNLPISAYYPLHLLLAGAACWIGVEAFLRPEFIVTEISIKDQSIPNERAAVTEELQQQSAWLRAQVEENLLYRNAGLTLRELADLLAMHPNELSYLINAGTGKNFNDFINSYRVNDVVRRIKDPAYHHITLLGIAYDCGFNSKTTFNRTFIQMIGISATDYRKKSKTAPKL